MYDVLLTPPPEYTRAEKAFEKIIDDINHFEKKLDNDHEVALKLASFGTSLTMLVTRIGYKNPNILIYCGYVNGKYSELIQHVNQLNFLITSVERVDKTKPARRIGFHPAAN